jgi:predicted DNA-binding transcriptional regulator
MWEFAEELGYVISTEKTFKNVQRIHKEVKRQHQALVKMFTKEELEQLQDIN